MEKKPLTKEERESVGVLIGELKAEYGKHYPATLMAIDAILSAEAYWRETVRTAHEPLEDCICVFCASDCKEHAAACPWLLANES